MATRSLPRQLTWLYLTSTAAVLVIGACVLLAVSWTLVREADRGAPKELGDALRRRGTALVNILSSDEAAVTEWLGREARVPWHIGRPGFQVLVPVAPETVAVRRLEAGGKPLVHLHVHGSAGDSGPPPELRSVESMAQSALRGESVQGWLESGPIFAAAAFPAGTGAVGTVVVTADLGPATGHWWVVAATVALVGGALLLPIVLVGLGFSRWASRRLGARLAGFDGVLADWGTDDFARRLPETPDDEIGTLGRRLNALAESLVAVRAESAEREARLYRSQVAQELHDGAKQELFATAAALAGLRGRVAGGHAVSAEELGDLARSLEAGRTELAAVITGAPRDAVDRVDVAPVLAEHARRYAAAHGLDLGWSAREADAPVGELAPAPMTYLRDCVRELLSNVARHAGATRVDVDLELTRGAITLTVEDDGVGLPPGATANGAGGLGLSGLARRAADVDAALEVTDREDRSGVRAVVRLRLDPDETSGRSAADRT
ncbi:MAG: ATP-binding protein [Planctomycetota bacterium]